MFCLTPPKEQRAATPVSRTQEIKEENNQANLCLPQVPFILILEGRHCHLLHARGKQIAHTDKLFLKLIKTTSVKCDLK